MSGNFVDMITTEKPVTVEIPERGCASLRRKDFMEAVATVVNLAHKERRLRSEERASLLDTAANMTRFPMGDWYAEDARCGCVVGTLMLESGLFDNDLKKGVLEEDDVYREADRRGFFAVGCDIDEAVRVKCGFPKYEPLDPVLARRVMYADPMLDIVD